MMNSHPRIQREEQTLRAMFRVYCRSVHHQKRDLCPDCLELENYALARLEHCPFQERKTTCAKCPVHCYRADMRTRVKTVMRSAGPKMLIWHPWLAIRHLMDGFQEKPLPKPGQESN